MTSMIHQSMDYLQLLRVSKCLLGLDIIVKKLARFTNIKYFFKLLPRDYIHKTFA